jgi:hypothetical protein
MKAKLKPSETKTIKKNEEHAPLYLCVAPTVQTHHHQSQGSTQALKHVAKRSGKCLHLAVANSDQTQMPSLEGSSTKDAFSVCQ